MKESWLSERSDLIKEVRKLRTRLTKIRKKEREKSIEVLGDSIFDEIKTHAKTYNVSNLDTILDSFSIDIDENDLILRITPFVILMPAPPQKSIVDWGKNYSQQVGLMLLDGYLLTLPRY